MTVLSTSDKQHSHSVCRVWLIVLLCGIFLGMAVQVQRGMTFQGIADLGLDVTDFPRESGVWKQVNQSDSSVAIITPQEKSDRASTIAYLAPISMFDRCYQNEEGTRAFLHFIWTKDYFRVHIPEKCYPGNGFSLQKSEDILVPGPNGQLFPVRLLTFANAQETRYVGYWFQYGRGPEAYYAMGEMPTRWARICCCFGKDSWPPLVKVMFDLRMEDSDPAKMLTTAESLTLEIQKFLWSGYPEFAAAPSTLVQDKQE